MFNCRWKLCLVNRTIGAERGKAARGGPVSYALPHTPTKFHRTDLNDTTSNPPIWRT